MFALALEDLDLDSSLTIGSSRERLRLLGGDGRVAGDVFDLLLLLDRIRLVLELVHR